MAVLYVVDSHDRTRIGISSGFCGCFLYVYEFMDIYGIYKKLMNEENCSISSEGVEYLLKNTYHCMGGYI